MSYPQKKRIHLGNQNIIEKINLLANLLDELKNTNYSGACWGYNFDWQARLLFLFPANTSYGCSNFILC